MIIGKNSSETEGLRPTNVELRGITEFNKLLNPCRTYYEDSQNIYWN